MTLALTIIAAYLALVATLALVLYRRPVSSEQLAEAFERGRADSFDRGFLAGVAAREGVRG